MEHLAYRFQVLAMRTIVIRITLTDVVARGVSVGCIGRGIGIGGVSSVAGVAVRYSRSSVAIDLWLRFRVCEGSGHKGEEQEL